MDNKRQKSKTSIPDVLIQDIISRSSIKTICRSKSVSKEWLEIISSREFVSKVRAVDRFLIWVSTDEYFVVFSIDESWRCNEVNRFKINAEVDSWRYDDGVLCFYDRDFNLNHQNNQLTIQNATNLEWIVLPPAESNDYVIYNSSGGGGGGFRVLCWSYNGGFIANAAVYELGAQQWRLIEVPPGFPHLGQCQGSISGSIYWLSRMQQRIVYFDHQIEVFSLLPYPLIPMQYAATLFEFHDTLCFSAQSIPNRQNIRIWTYVPSQNQWISRFHFVIPIQEALIGDAKFFSLFGDIGIFVATMSNEFIIRYNVINHQVTPHQLIGLHYTSNFSLHIENPISIDGFDYDHDEGAEYGDQDGEEYGDD